MRHRPQQAKLLLPLCKSPHRATYLFPPSSKLSTMQSKKKKKIVSFFAKSYIIRRPRRMLPTPYVKPRYALSQPTCLTVSKVKSPLFLTPCTSFLMGKNLISSQNAHPGSFISRKPPTVQSMFYENLFSNCKCYIASMCLLGPTQANTAIPADNYEYILFSPPY